LKLYTKTRVSRRDRIAQFQVRGRLTKLLAKRLSSSAIFPLSQTQEIKSRPSNGEVHDKGTTHRVAGRFKLGLDCCADADTQKLTGWVSDRACGRSISADCNNKCIEGGTPAVLVVDKTGDILSVSNPDPLKEHAGKHVEVTGTLNDNVLTVAEVLPLNDPATPKSDPPPVSVHLPDHKGFVQFPLEIMANGIYVPVKVNGKGPYLFEIDTGSSNSVIAAELAAELGIQTEGSMQGMGAGSDSNAMGMISNLDFLLPQGLTFSTQQGATVAMSGLWPLIGRRMYGDLGYDVIGDFVLEINYEKKLVTFHDAETFHYSGTGTSFPFKLLGGSDPQIQGALIFPGRVLESKGPLPRRV